jgi:hypothetical protein
MARHCPPLPDHDSVEEWTSAGRVDYLAQGPSSSAARTNALAYRDWEFFINLWFDMRWIEIDQITNTAMSRYDIHSVVLIALVACGILIVLLREFRSGSSFSRYRWRRSYRRTHQSQRSSSTPDLQDVGQQLRAVMGASFQKQRLLNGSEYRVFKIIEADIAAESRGYRVFAQTNLGEVLSSPNDDAFRSINSKRVDILIVDQGGWPVVAIEHQGAGHYQGTAAARDAIKKEALRKAGIRYVEVSETDTEEQIRLRVRENLGWRNHSRDPLIRPRVG